MWPRDVAEDVAGHGNRAAEQYSVSVELGRPEVVISGPASEQTGPFNVMITFSKSVTGFEKEEVTVGNGRVLRFNGSGERYRATIAPEVTGTVTVDVAQDVAFDAAGHGNRAADQYSVRVVADRPTVRITGPTETQTGPFEVAITFSRSVKGFEQGDVTVGNGAVTAFSGGEIDDSYAATIEPESSGTVTVDVAEFVAFDGEGNGNTAADQYSVEASYLVPRVTIADASADEGDAITFTVKLDQDVSDGLTVAPDFTDGTATLGVDYDPSGPTLHFTGTAGESQRFTVETTEDTVIETDETFTVTLEVVHAEEEVIAKDTATGTIIDDDSAEVTIADASAIEGDAITFTVTLDRAVVGGLTVTPIFADGTATEGADYEENTKPLSFTGTEGETLTFTVGTIDDTVVESDEIFTVSLEVSGTTATVTATDTATGTITEDGSAAVTIADASGEEGDSLTFTVTLDQAVVGGLTVTPRFTDGTAVEGADYEENTKPLSFTGASGEQQTFTVSTTEDAVAEAAESFTVTLAVSGTPARVTTSDTATGTINDDDNAAVTIADASANEGDAITFSLTLDKAVEGGLTVTPSFTDVTATEGTDYTENTAALSFTGTVGETRTFTVSTTEDTAAEANETFAVRLAVSGTSATVRPTYTATHAATGTITDDDNAAVTVDDAVAAEGYAPTFTVRLNKAVSGGLRVTPGFKDGTATGGTDYTENRAVLTFSGNADETQSFGVPTIEDTDVETDETFTVSLSVFGTGTTVEADDTAKGTILDDDSAIVTIADALATEGDTIAFTVTLDNAVSGGLTVTPGYTDVTATEGTDYTENTTALTFTGTAGETKTFTVATTEDTVVETDETFRVGLTVSGTSASVTATDTATGTISNDDGSAAVTVNDASANEGDALSFTVTLDKAVAEGLKVRPGFTDRTATGGTDYTENTAVLTFTGTAGETKTFTVATIEDAVVETNETFTVGLTVSGTSVTVTATDTGTGTITDDDSTVVTIADASAAEGDALSFTVTLDKAVAGGLKVTPGFTDGTATEGTDYTENTSVLTFTGTAGETQTFTVATTEDTLVETNETFTVGLTVSGTSASVTATDTGTGTITDDDSAAVTVNDASASEGDALSFTVTLDKAVAGGLKVTPGFTDGTATEGTDYTENTAVLTFTGTVGETKTFTVATTEDTVVETNETFTVGLAVSGTSVTVTAADTGTGTITNDDGGAAVTVNDASASEGDALSFTVTLDKAVAGGLKVTPGFTDVTATEGTDYTENTSVLTFTGTAGETKTFTVSTTEDTVVETNETFTVGLTVSGTSVTVTATDTGTGTITNDDGSAAVTVNDASANEGDALTFTVTLDKAVGGGLKVTPGFTDGTATEGTDYTENTSELTFTGTAGETRTFTVATTEDTVVETNETFTVGLTVSGTSVSVTASDTGTGTITNDDGSAAVTVNNASANEGDALTFTVTLDKAVAGGLKVTPGFTDGTATEGTDYTENTAVLTFTGTAGETRTFTVATTEDTVVETNETFTVGLTVSGTSVSVTATDTGTGTITNDDSAAVTIGDVSAAEGDSLTFTVTLDNAVSGGLKVTPSFTDGTATEGTDYTENTSALTFAGNAGETQSFTVATTEDTAVEADETFTVGLAVSEASATVTATDTATGTITNDDGSAAVTIGDASAEEGEAITFTVTLNKAVDGGLKVTPSFTDVTATKGTDYTENTSTLTFTGTVGETKTFTVATTEDTATEHHETFTVSLAVTGTSAAVTDTDTATGTITDDDGALAAVTIGDVSAAEGDDLTFTVTLDNAVTGGFKVTPSFTDGTATEGADYTENTTALTFAGTAGETQSFTVSTTEDTAVEADETFTVSLAVSEASATVTASDTATGTITNDDGSAEVTIEDASAEEGESITFTVTLNKAVSGGLKVTPSFTDVTATKGAGSDYTENTAALTFAGNAGETQSFTVSTTEDTATEHHETFTVSLAVTGTSAAVTDTDTATGTITDDDGALAAVTIDNASAAEGDSLTFTVTLDNAVSGGLKVTPSFTDGTATEGTDYTENTSVLTFAGTAGETQSFTVSTTEDTAVEADETFTVGLAVSEASATVTASDTATGTITNDDGSAEVTIEDASADEGDAITFTVTLNKAVAGGFKVTPSFTDVTATKGTDYTENTAALTFAGNANETRSFTVSTTEDTGKEHHETFTVSLAVTGTSAAVTDTDTATGKITDDDGALAAVTIGDVSAAEGDSLTFTVTLDNAVTGGFKVTPSFTDGTATEGADYTENTAALTFAGTAGETQSFTVATTEDTAVEADETFTVSLAVSEASATVTASDTATGTITNDDGSAEVTIEDASAEEGEAITFTVTLNKAVDGGLKVTPGFTDVTATKGTDYTENAAALTFAGTAGETRSFTVSTTEDTATEHHETFTVSLAVTGTSAEVTDTDTATGTITDDDGALAAVTIGDVSAAEGDDLTFTVTLDNAVTGGFKVTPSFTDGTATEGADYTENTAALTFAGTAGETQSFTVATTEDTAVEADETFTVSLAVSEASATVTASDTATGTITNDDGSAEVTIEDASAEEGESITFTVTLNKAVSGGLKVTPSFTDVTATKGTDYTENTAALTFAGTVGETKTFTVATTEDTGTEHHETFTVSLAVTGTSAEVTDTDTATGTITDDDGALAAVTIGDVSAAEGDDLTFTVTLDNAVTGGFKVTPSFTDGTATEGTDYTENTAALTFAGTAGETQSFTVATTEDTAVEADETFTVGLAVSEATATVTASDTATGTITNDDGSAEVTIEDASADEGDAITVGWRFTVTLNKAVAGGFKVTPSFTDVTATKGTGAGSDYTENTAALTFAGNAGETQSFTVATTEDTAKEHHETFTVSLAVTGTSAEVTDTDTATGTITDDDGALAAVTIDNASAAEGDSI